MAGRQNGSDKRVERTRQAILATAEDLFLAQGFPGTSMDQIADAAGLSKQTLYAHFISKAALFVAVIDAITASAASTIRDEAGPPPDRSPGDYLTHFARAQIAIVIKPRPMRLRRLMIAEAERFPDLARALHRAGPGRAIATLAAAIGHYAATGKLRAPDPEVAARSFNWLLMGGPTTDAMLLGEAGFPSPDAAARHVVETVRVFLAAYGR